MNDNINIYIDKLNRDMEELLDIYFDIDYECNLSTDFATYLDLEEIDYSLITLPRMDKMFTEVLHKYFNYDFADEMDMWCITMLHEVGHIKTDAKIPKTKKKADRIAKKIITVFSKNDKVAKKYFLLPTEYAATRWAVRWVKKHPSDYTAFMEKAKGLINNFYRNTGVTR